MGTRPGRRARVDGNYGALPIGRPASVMLGYQRGTKAAHAPQNLGLGARGPSSVAAAAVRSSAPRRPPPPMTSALVVLALMQSPLSAQPPPTATVALSEAGAAQALDAHDSSWRWRVGECQVTKRNKDGSGGTGDVENARQ